MGGLSLSPALGLDACCSGGFKTAWSVSVPGKRWRWLSGGGTAVFEAVMWAQFRRGGFGPVLPCLVLLQIRSDQIRSQFPSSQAGNGRLVGWASKRASGRSWPVIDPLFVNAFSKEP